MKILLLGASGMVGSRILAEAAGRGHDVIAVARDTGRIAEGGHVEAVAGSLGDPGLADLAKRSDAVVAAVSPRGGGDPREEAPANARAAIALAKAAGVRLVMVGGAGTLSLPDGSPVLPHVPEPYAAEAAGMKAAFQQVQASAGVDWTVIAPAAVIAPGERTGTFRTGRDVLISDANGQSHISAEDYAAALVDELERPANRLALMTVGY